MAEDLSEEYVVGLVLRFEAVAADGGVGAASGLVSRVGPVFVSERTFSNYKVISLSSIATAFRLAWARRLLLLSNVLTLTFDCPAMDDQLTAPNDLAIDNQLRPRD